MIADAEMESRHDVKQYYVTVAIAKTRLPVGRSASFVVGMTYGCYLISRYP